MQQGDVLDGESIMDDEKRGQLLVDKTVTRGNIEYWTRKGDRYSRTSVGILNQVRQ